MMKSKRLLADLDGDGLVRVLRGHVVALGDIVREVRSLPSLDARTALARQLDRLESALIACLGRLS